MQFSIVIPAYNRADTILPTLQSVQAQTFDDFECLIVDDGSKDGAALKQVVEGMNDPRFHYIHRENGGGGAARNTGIMAAKGDYIAFLDSDDFFSAREARARFIYAALPQIPTSCRFFPDHRRSGGGKILD